MREFPGVIQMTKGMVHRRVLNDEQLAWLRRWFPVTENNRLCKAMGISHFKLHEFARENGLTKSEAGMKAIKRRQRPTSETAATTASAGTPSARPPARATADGGRKSGWDCERTPS